MRIPDVKRAHRGESCHCLLVTDNGARRQIANPLVSEVVVTPGEHETRGETFQIPLPGTGKGLIEVIDVEDLIALRRRERAKVRQVGIATDLGRKPG